MLVFYSFSSSAGESLTNITSYLQKTPADIVGSFHASAPTMLYENKSGLLDLGIRLNPNKSVNFSFSEKHISITPEESIDILVQGIRVPVKVKSLYYHESTGKFEVKTESPLGLVDKVAKEKIETELANHFKTKLQLSFRELKKFRSENGIKDTGKILNTIMDIFKTGRTSAPFPDITGSMELVFTPPRNETIMLDKLKAEVKKDDRLAASIGFSKRGPDFKINSLEIYSTKGVGIAKRDGNPNGVVALNFSRITLGKEGLETRYTIGAEELIGGMAMAFEVLKGINGMAHAPLDPNCLDDVQLEKFRKSLDTKLQAEIANLIRTNRPALLRAKFDPRLLDALD